MCLTDDEPFTDVLFSFLNSCVHLLLNSDYNSGTATNDRSRKETSQRNNTSSEAILSVVFSVAIMLIRPVGDCVSLLYVSNAGLAWV